MTKGELTDIKFRMDGTKPRVGLLITILLMALATAAAFALFAIVDAIGSKDAVGSYYTLIGAVLIILAILHLGRTHLGEPILKLFGQWNDETLERGKWRHEFKSFKSEHKSLLKLPFRGRLSLAWFRVRNMPERMLYFLVSDGAILSLAIILMFTEGDLTTPLLVLGIVLSINVFFSLALIGEKLEMLRLDHYTELNQIRREHGREEIPWSVYKDFPLYG